MIRRRFFMGGGSSGGGLPDEYQAIEFLRSTGTQYIKTGLVINDEFEITSHFASQKRAAQSSAYAAIQNGTYAIGYNFQSTQYANPTNAYGWWWCANGSNTSMLDSVTYDTGDYEMAHTPRAVSVNGISYTPAGGTLTYPNLELYIFARNVNNGAANYAIMDLYSMTIKVAGVVVRDFVPCYRKSDNELGLYDTVHDVFYTNSGSGSFTVGPDV